MTELSLFETLLCTLAFCAVIGSLLFTLDDLWIDLYALWHGLKPHELSEMEVAALHSKSQKKIAIIVANWHEDEILERMIIGNLAQVDYQNYSFFLGVYPNDEKTWRVARELEQRFSNVIVIVNSKPGPTTKGQMLNEMISHIIRSETKTQIKYDLFLLQDSEDVLHPLSLKLINSTADDSDFIQIPIFSFHLPWRKFVGATYLDEFSEIHTKDLLVRERMGAAIPSAGVGTAMSHRLVQNYRTLQNGNLLREDTLTEDYDLGISAKLRGFKSRFVCAYRLTRKAQKDFIATREFFPARFWNSVRQKTRWTLGIAFQGYQNIGWQGDWVDRYFLFRDRRGPINAVLIVLSLLTLGIFVGYGVSGLQVPWPLSTPLFVSLAALNLLNMSARLIQRFRAVLLVNGLQHALLVPVRWPLSNLINCLAAFRASKAHVKSLLTGAKPQWSKTKHELPAHFGDVPAESLEVQR